jgi:hypothetical protein
MRKGVLLRLWYHKSVSPTLRSLRPTGFSTHRPGHTAMSRRFQFSLKALLVAMLAICCFLGGMVVQKQLDEPEWISKGHPASEMSTDESALQIIRLPDGTEWQRNIWGKREDQSPEKQPAPVPDSRYVGKRPVAPGAQE